MNRVHGPKNQGKSFDIPKRLVWDAYLKVRENKGSGRGGWRDDRAV